MAPPPVLFVCKIPPSFEGGLIEANSYICQIEEIKAIIIHFQIPNYPFNAISNVTYTTVLPSLDIDFSLIHSYFMIFITTEPLWKKPPSPNNPFL